MLAVVHGSRVAKPSCLDRPAAPQYSTGLYPERLLCRDRFYGRTQGPLSLHRQANRRQMLKTRNASESPHKGGNGAFIQSHRSRAKVFVGVAIF